MFKADKLINTDYANPKTLDLFEISKRSKFSEDPAGSSRNLVDGQCKVGFDCVSKV